MVESKLALLAQRLEDHPYPNQFSLCGIANEVRKMDQDFVLVPREDLPHFHLGIAKRTLTQGEAWLIGELERVKRDLAASQAEIKCKKETIDTLCEANGKFAREFAKLGNELEELRSEKPSKAMIEATARELSALYANKTAVVPFEEKCGVRTKNIRKHWRGEAKRVLSRAFEARVLAPPAVGVVPSPGAKAEVLNNEKKRVKECLATAGTK